MNTEESGSATVFQEPLERSLEIDSVAIKRMIEEVRSNDPVATAGHYNRTHNKHNR